MVFDRFGQPAAKKSCSIYWGCVGVTHVRWHIATTADRHRDWPTDGRSKGIRGNPQTVTRLCKYIYSIFWIQLLARSFLSLNRLRAKLVVVQQNSGWGIRMWGVDCECMSLCGYSIVLNYRRNQIKPAYNESTLWTTLPNPHNMTKCACQRRFMRYDAIIAEAIETKRGEE